MSEDLILYRVENGIATLTFHRPEALNALNSRVLEALSSAVDAAEADENVRVIVFTGEGKSFIAGADLKELDGKTGPAVMEYSRKGAALFRRIELLPKPTIAAVNGYAFGGGFEFLLCTDLRIMSTRAKLQMPEVTLGIVPGFNGTQRLPKCVGLAKAKELIFTARPVNAEEALALGIVNAIAEPESLMGEVYQLASRIAGNSASAISLAKAAMNAGAALDIDAGAQIELGYMAASFGTPDQIKGFAAFKERRAAKTR